MNKFPRAARKEAGFLLLALAVVLGLLAGSPLGASAAAPGLGEARMISSHLQVGSVRAVSVASEKASRERRLRGRLTIIADGLWVAPFQVEGQINGRRS